jgi:PIN domain nuclease of toxin-antitoxin system
LRCLVDTHVWLWLQASPELVAPDAHAVLRDRRNVLYFSAASSWEIAIKYAVGRLALPDEPARYVPDRMRRSGMTPLHVEHADALAVAALARHHGDPFDRMLIAQAQARRIPIVTRDDVFETYGVEVIPA